MVDLDNQIKKDIFIPIIILNFIIILITLYLSILFIKSKELHIYPCYNFLILSFIILLDNILRLIPVPEDKEIFQYIQAFLLTSLDKLLLAIITFQAFIAYLGVVKTKFYYNSEKIIFFFGLFLCILISFLIGGLYVYSSDYLEHYGLYYYCYSELSYKKPLDVTFNSIFLAINSFSIIIMLIYMFNKKEKAEEGMIEDLGYNHHYWKILLMFIVNSLGFIVSYLIIYDIMDVLEEYIDLVYLSICLLIDLFYTFNKIIYKETLKIFCKKIYDEKYPENKSNKTNGTTESERETEIQEVKSSDL